mmetsp:Transcript_92006/g.269169  ORF Transcript_92006/g.269169 Transcript_92006/m.269169 type:complete len:236 (-) Transcript_92006:2189-2896(-)
MATDFRSLLASIPAFLAPAASHYIDTRLRSHHRPIMRRPGQHGPGGRRWQGLPLGRHGARLSAWSGLLLNPRVASSSKKRRIGRNGSGVAVSRKISGGPRAPTHAAPKSETTSRTQLRRTKSPCPWRHTVPILQSKGPQASAPSSPMGRYSSWCNGVGQARSHSRKSGKAGAPGPHRSLRHAASPTRLPHALRCECGPHASRGFRRPSSSGAPSPHSPGWRSSSGSPGRSGAATA